MGNGLDQSRGSLSIAPPGRVVPKWLHAFEPNDEVNGIKITRFKAVRHFTPVPCKKVLSTPLESLNRACCGSRDIAGMVCGFHSRLESAATPAAASLRLAI